MYAYTHIGTDFNIHTNWAYAEGEAVVRDGGVKSERSLSMKIKEKQASEVKQKIDSMPGSDLPGFIPLREDFDVEYVSDFRSSDFLCFLCFLCLLCLWDTACRLISYMQ